MAPEDALALLDEASRQFLLPVNIDRSLRELKETNLAAAVIVQRIIELFERRA
jgi:hypothetical protein